MMTSTTHSTLLLLVVIVLAKTLLVQVSAFQPTTIRGSSSSCRIHLQSPQGKTMITTSASISTNLFATARMNEEERTAGSSNIAATAVHTFAISTMLSMMVLFNTNVQPVMASDRAAQISLQSIPPTSISIQIEDLPVIGKLISGVYTKVPETTKSTSAITSATDTTAKKPSIVIQSPVDKVGAIANIAKGGHLEFDVSGKINTHLDIDVAADEPGTLKVLIQSNLIPKLPFKNMASTAFTSPIVGGKESAWNIVTNMGTGESYYYNAKTGVTQLVRPDRI